MGLETCGSRIIFPIYTYMDSNNFCTELTLRYLVVSNKVY